MQWWTSINGSLDSPILYVVQAAWNAAIDAAANEAIRRKEFNETNCPDTCNCADGYHIAEAIRMMGKCEEKP